MHRSLAFAAMTEIVINKDVQKVRKRSIKEEEEVPLIFVLSTLKLGDRRVVSLLIRRLSRVI